MSEQQYRHRAEQMEAARDEFNASGALKWRTKTSIRNLKF